MSLNKIIECENKQLRRLSLLPASFKKTGFLLMIVSLAAILITSVMLPESGAIRSLAMNGLLLSMLIVSITKEKDEDEYITQLRAQSYSLAFISGVLFAIFQPYISLFVEFIVEPDQAVYSAFSAFAILWFMLFVQLGFYYVLKLSR